MQSQPWSQGEAAPTQIVVQPMVVSPQTQNGYVSQQCPAIARFIGPQYWPAWSFILGAIGFFLYSWWTSKYDN